MKRKEPDFFKSAPIRQIRVLFFPQPRQAHVYMSFQERRALFPVSVEIVDSGDGPSLAIGGCELTALAAEYGTPLYLYDQATLAAAVDTYRRALADAYPAGGEITYAGKAGLNLALARWMDQQGVWLDCTGVGELYVAQAAGVDRSRVLVHGVAKTNADLQAAVRQAGTIVVDNLDELQRLVNLAAAAPPDQPFPDLWLRILPGLAVDTHAFRQTGQEDSKFGMDAATARHAVVLCLEHDLPLTGLHFHQGSHFHDPAPIGPAVEMVLDLAAALRDEFGWTPGHLSPGGGWGVAYHEDDLPQPAVEEYVAFIAKSLIAGCEKRGLSLPVLHVEPGRSLVARAGVALYRVRAVKHTATRRWLLLDGGMADNIRPALYGARYSAAPVTDPLRADEGPAWLAGPYCESGDILVEDLPMPAVETDELIAVPVSGAYQIAMSSNYNGALKPAALWLEAGRAHVIQRRQTVEDLIARDEFGPPALDPGGNPP
jgi:diaminopimelate decarboxylase